MKKFLKKKKKIIFLVLGIILILTCASAFVILRSNYSFELKFNDEKISFFNKETLYFNGKVNVVFTGNGYTTKLDKKEFKKTVSITKDGSYKISFHKLLKNYYIILKVESKPDFYLVDQDNNVIHNYLSNSSPFRIIKNNDKANIYLNNVTYKENTVIEKNDNYIVGTDSEIFTVNILNIKN